MQALNSACRATSDLERIRIFQSVNLDLIGELLQNCPVRELVAGERLIAKGRPNDTIYLLLSGRLKVRLDAEEDADSTIILEGGETVGEMSVIDGSLTSADVTAASHCRLLVVDEDTLWTIMDNMPVVARNLMHVLTARLRHGNSLLRQTRRKQLRSEQRAITDPLTGLLNRRWLEEMLPRQMETCEASGQFFSLFIADIDHFKDFNDSHGHLAGDRAIVAVAKAVQDNLRKGDMAVRFGGEEFLVLLPGSGRAAARMVAERIRQAVKDTKVDHSDGTALPSVTVSIGMATMNSPQRPDELIETADKALYRAKLKGRNSVVD